MHNEKFKIKIHNNAIDSLESLPINIKVSMYNIFELLETFGNELREPYTKALGNGLFEIRAKGKEGIARAFYTYDKEKTIIILHCFIKKTQKIPKQELLKAQKILADLKEQS